MAERLKDLFFTSASIAKLAQAIERAYPAFDVAQFRALLYDDAWESKELMARMHHTAYCLGQTLPAYPKALQILKRVAPHVSGFEGIMFADFIQQFGQNDWKRSLPALKFFTRFGSAEFAIRAFLAQDSQRALAYLYEWAEDKDHHVRRLASEGCRPRLPWAMALPQFKQDPRPLLPILERLKDDESEYVRKSVSNNLNDISKDHPELVLEIAERWYGKAERTDWVVRHALRGLLKARNARALALFGVNDAKHIAVKNFALDKTRVQIGAGFTFSFALRVGGKQARSVRLEYAIDFVRGNGGSHKKVFQIAERAFAPGLHMFRKKHSMVNRTTRKHFAGTHHIVIVVNGKERAGAEFEVVT